ncbi:MAG: polysaccharide biosynthesis protein, partial [Limisphaerales bacterium]
IGSELVRQIHRYQPAYLGVLDRDETGIQAVQLSIDGHGLLDSDSLILADIRDRARIEEVLSTTRPNIIFHAAALKHLPMSEMYPQEAWKTNIEGTVHLLQAAIDMGVNTFVNISTDKAADPISVLGMSKMITERLTAWAADQTGRAFVSVRFGNVLGSRGSVLNTFRTQIEAGGPVTITDQAATRFFMTISEAVHLVLQAAAIGEGGSTLILDMGDPVNIESVARQLIEMSGTNVELTYVGLRPGEKVHELLTGTNEISMPTAHPKVTQVQVTAMEPTALENLSGRGPTEMQRLLAQPSPTLRG